MIIKIKNDVYYFKELEYLLVISFLIRIRKEYNRYYLCKPHAQITLNSYNEELIMCNFVGGKIIIKLKGKSYFFDNCEFSKYIDYVYSLINNEYSIPGVDYRTFDEVFLEHMLAADIPYMYKSSIEELYLEELRVYTFSKKILPLNESEHYLMVKNNRYVDICTRTNLFNQSHISRYQELVKNFDIKSYKEKENYIILYNNTNIIRDGSHRAAILYHKYGNIKVKIRRLFFSKNNYSFGLLMENNIYSFYSLLNSSSNTRWLKVNRKKIGVIRSDALSELSNNEVELLKRNNIKTIIDLRNFKNREQPAFLKHRFRYYNIPIIYTNKKTKIETDLFMQKTDEYNFYLLSQTEKIKRVFEIIHELDGNLLIMCTMGRDRTGLVCAIIQMLLGCSDEEIIEEFAFSDLIYKNDIRYLDTKFDYIETKEKMKKFILAFKKKIYSAEKYLLMLGFSIEEIEKIKEKLRYS